MIPATGIYLYALRFVFPPTTGFPKDPSKNHTRAAGFSDRIEVIHKCFSASREIAWSG
jgi:hypothetical protein